MFLDHQHIEADGLRLAKAQYRPVVFDPILGLCFIILAEDTNGPENLAVA